MNSDNMSNGPIRVLLVEFNPVVHAGLRSILDHRRDIVVAKTATKQHEALEHLRAASAQGESIHVALVDVTTGERDSVAITRSIIEHFPEIAVLILSESLSSARVIESIEAGAGGFLLLDDMTEASLSEAIRGVVRGGAQVSTNLLREAVDALIRNGRQSTGEQTTSAAHLTEREIEVLRLLVRGESNKGIAHTLKITLDTTKKHVGNVVSKLGATSRTHAAVIAAQAGIVPLPNGTNESESDAPEGVDQRDRDRAVR